jgi:hypothetical protein
MRNWVDAFDRVPVGHIPAVPPRTETKEAHAVQRIALSIRVGSWRLWCALAVRRLAR